MINIFEEHGYQALDAFCMSNTLFAFDYDGTLAPIVDDPKLAVMRPETSQLIEQLARYVPVALISGRARGDVSSFLPTSVDYIVGNHGLEGLPGGDTSLRHAEKSSQTWAEDLRQHLVTPGATIENKTYSLSIHYRKCADKKKAKIDILRLVSTLEPPPRVVLGKCVVNLISSGSPHKGAALLEIMLHSGCRSAVYFGDDDNDEDVFSLGDESPLTVRVGKEETSSAMFYLDSQYDVDKVLQHCVSSLKKTGRTLRTTAPTGVVDEPNSNNSKI